jgi:hypothetical protein
MAKSNLDPDALPTLAATEAARLDAMSDDEITIDEAPDVVRQALRKTS